MANDIVRSVLARGWTFEIGDGATFVKIGGINNCKLGQSKTDANTTTFDSLGADEHLPASRGRTITLEGNYLENKSTGARDAGQMACAVASSMVDVEGLYQIRITSPGGTIEGFYASVKLLDIGGGNNDKTSWGVEFTVSGAEAL